MKAFPHDSTNQYGMDLRDYFAGLAMQGMLANSQQQEYFDDNIAHLAYSLADAMMKARDK